MDPSDVSKEALSVCRGLFQAGHEAYVVGGCVRDVILGRAATDWDVATSAPAEDVQATFRRTIPTGLKHGTVTVMIRDVGVEVTTFRSESQYSDGRHPDKVTFGVTLEEDLSRRDFTINAIAYDPIADRLVDPFDGRRDLKAGVLRAVGQASERFCEDALRILRAVRFCATLEFALDEDTEAGIGPALVLLKNISPERVQAELIKLLAARKPSMGLVIAQRAGVLDVVLPEICDAVGQPQNAHHKFDVWEHTLATVDATPGDGIVRLGALLHDVAKPRTASPKPDHDGEYTFYSHDAVGAEMTDAIMRRLKFSKVDRERVVAMVAHHMFWYTPEWSDATVRRFVRRVTPERLPDLFALRVGDVVGRGFGEEPEKELGVLRARVDKVLHEDQALSVGDLLIDGATLMELLHIPPGPKVGIVLRALLERVIDEPELNTADRLRELAIEVAAQS